jgi:hypothetical protein
VLNLEFHNQPDLVNVLMDTAKTMAYVKVNWLKDYSLLTRMPDLYIYKWDIKVC